MVDCWYDTSLDSEEDNSVEGSVGASISTNSTIDKSSDVLDHEAFQAVIQEAVDSQITMDNNETNSSNLWEYIDCVEDDYEEETTVEGGVCCFSITGKQKRQWNLPCAKLEQTISDKFLCKFCIEEQLERKKEISSKVLNNTTLVANTYNAAFACCLTVTCKSGNYKSNVIPEHLGGTETEETMEIGENGKCPCDHPRSIY